MTDRNATQKKLAKIKRNIAVITYGGPAIMLIAGFGLAVLFAMAGHPTSQWLVCDIFDLRVCGY